MKSTLLILLFLFSCVEGPVPNPTNEDLLPKPPKGTGSNDITVKVLYGDWDHSLVRVADVMIQSQDDGTLIARTIGDPPEAKFRQVSVPFSLTMANFYQEEGVGSYRGLTVQEFSPQGPEITLPAQHSSSPYVAAEVLAGRNGTLSGGVTGISPSSDTFVSIMTEEGIWNRFLEVQPDGGFSSTELSVGKATVVAFAVHKQNSTVDAVGFTNVEVSEGTQTIPVIALMPISSQLDLYVEVQKLPEAPGIDPTIKQALLFMLSVPGSIGSVYVNALPLKTSLPLSGTVTVPDPRQIGDGTGKIALGGLCT